MDNANIISEEGWRERLWSVVEEDNYYLAMTTETMSDSITMTDDAHSVWAELVAGAMTPQSIAHCHTLATVQPSLVAITDLKWELV